MGYTKATLIATAAVVTVGALSNTPSYGQDNSRRHKTVFEQLNERAASAITHDAGSVRKLTDDILDRFSFLHIPTQHSLRNRIFGAEHKSRHGLRQPVSEMDVANAVNDFVDTVQAPSWAKTNVEQLHLFRTVLKPHFPLLVGTQPHRDNAGNRPPWAISSDMAPAEAILVVLYLARGKLTMPEYQMSPEAWIQQLRDLKAARQGQHAVIQPMNRPMLIIGPALPRFKHALETDLADENGVVAQQAHAFLDRLGLDR